MLVMFFFFKEAVIEMSEDKSTYCISFSYEGS